MTKLLSDQKGEQINSDASQNYMRLLSMYSVYGEEKPVKFNWARGQSRQ